MEKDTTPSNSESIEQNSSVPTITASNSSRSHNTSSVSNKNLWGWGLIVSFLVLIGIVVVLSAYIKGSTSVFIQSIGSFFGIPFPQNITQTKVVNPNYRDAIVFFAADQNSDNFDLNHYLGINVYLYTASGKIKNLTYPYGGEYPTFSPDKTRIAYTAHVRGKTTTSAQVIMVMNVDGSGKKIISRHQGLKYDPSWSPDGTKILYPNEAWPTAPEESGKKEFVQIDLNSGKESILPTPYKFISFPTWLPDGSGYSFISAELDATTRRSIYHFILSRNGKFSELKPSPSASPSSSITEAEFSQDMKKVVYVNTDHQVYIMNADGTGIKNLTNSLDILYTCLSWSKDNSFILAQTQENTKNKGMQSALVKINVYDGSETKIHVNGLKDMGCPRIISH